MSETRVADQFVSPQRQQELVAFALIKGETSKAIALAIEEAAAAARRPNYYNSEQTAAKAAENRQHLKDLGDVEFLARELNFDTHSALGKAVVDILCDGIAKIIVRFQ